MKALRSFVGRLDPLALLGAIAIQNHRIHAQNHDLRVPEPQPPEKQLLDQAPKQPDPPEGEPTEKPLDLVGGDHRFGVHLDRPV